MIENNQKSIKNWRNNMLDIKRVREDFENVKAAVERRGKGDYDGYCLSGHVPSK